MVYKWLNIGLSLLYPHACPLCGSRSPTPLCRGCEQDMPVILTACARCGIGLPANNNNLHCGACLTEPPAYQKLLCAYAYQYPVNHLITALKYQHHLSLIPMLADSLTRHIEKETLAVDALLPVPLHVSRMRERGFNQSLEIVRYLASHFSLPILQNVERHKATATQASLPAQERASNVRGTFRLRAPIYHRRVAIIDDVVTTGSTVNEIAKLLKSAGVEEIEVWCIARAV